MAGTIQLIGVYPINTVEPVHLVEVLVTDAFDDVEWEAFTQESSADLVTDVDGSEDADAESTSHAPRSIEILADGRTRVAFFFHALDVTRPLLSPFGPLTLPAPTRRPTRLATVVYGPPL
jgi:hypothetical protein